MTYIEGFVIPVPTASREKFIEHARLADEVFMEHGASRILECWQEDVPAGHTTDFIRAVDAQDGESVVFSWVEWADKQTREANMERLQKAMESDDRFNPEKNPMPFDGKRMIYGGFTPIVEQGQPTDGAYIQGFLLAVPEAKQEAYRKMAEDAWPFFQKHGALRLIEGWQDDVPQGKQTDFFRAVKAEPDERVLFSFVEWPSKEVCDAASQNMQSDPDMKMPPEMPFDGKRMIYGGFTPVVELTGERV